MAQLSVFSSPLFLGFDEFEEAIDRLAKAPADGYPPYNIEQIGKNGLRISLAVAGFGRNDLAIQVEDNQLVVRGKQADDKDRIYLHRGIATRQFKRNFLLAEGIEVTGACLDDGLLHIDLHRRSPAGRVRKIAIGDAAVDGDGKPGQAIDVEAD